MHYRWTSPRAGVHGVILATGRIRDRPQSKAYRTVFKRPKSIAVPNAAKPRAFAIIQGREEHNLKNIDVSFRWRVCCVRA